jgi:hypothetical protein
MSPAATADTELVETTACDAGIKALPDGKFPLAILGVTVDLGAGVGIVRTRSRDR